MSAENNDIVKALRAMSGRAEGTLDQRFKAVRVEYESLPPNRRKALRRWASTLASLGQLEPGNILVRGCAEFLIPSGPSEIQSVRVPAKSLLAAISAWDKGKPFTPKAMQDA